jgi:hypothetical protein
LHIFMHSEKSWGVSFLYVWDCDTSTRTGIFIDNVSPSGDQPWPLPIETYSWRWFRWILNQLAEVFVHFCEKLL